MTQLTIAVDLDGVLAQYDRWRGVTHIGEPIPGAGEFLRALRRVARVVIYTTRTSGDRKVTESQESVAMLRERVRLWLDGHGLEYDDIHTGPGKPLYAAIVDDRAVSCRPMDDPGNVAVYDLALAQVKGLIGSAA